MNMQLFKCIYIYIHFYIEMIKLSVCACFVKVFEYVLPATCCLCLLKYMVDLCGFMRLVLVFMLLSLFNGFYSTIQLLLLLLLSAICFDNNVADNNDVCSSVSFQHTVKCIAVDCNINATIIMAKKKNRGLQTRETIVACFFVLVWENAFFFVLKGQRDLFCVTDFTLHNSTTT